MQNPTRDVPRFDPMDDATRERLKDLQGRQGLHLFDPRVQAALPRKWQLHFQQPSGVPDQYPGPVRYLIENPGNLAATAKWKRFRDFLAARAIGEPDDPNFPVMVKAADELLAWRAGIAPEDHFWKPDT